MADDNKKFNESKESKTNCIKLNLLFNIKVVILFGFLNAAI